MYNIFINNKPATAGDCLELENGENGNIQSTCIISNDGITELHITLKKYDVMYIITKSNDLYKLPVALCKSISEAAKYIHCNRVRLSTALLLGEDCNGYNIEAVKVFE